MSGKAWGGRFEQEPAELAAFLQGEMTKWGGLIKEIGIKVE